MNKNSNYKNVSLDELLQSSDFISIHSPLNDDTNNLLNATNIPLIKEKAILLNLGRGGIVNEEDISYEVDKREIYFGTDVVSKEPIEKDSPLLRIKNKNRVLFTPHIAWASKESRERLVNLIKQNIKEYLL
jgi:glycerate dehydrogenase